MQPMIKSRVGNWSKIIVPVPLPEDQYIVLASCFVLVPNARASSFVRDTMLINVQVLSALWLLADYTSFVVLKFSAWTRLARETCLLAVLADRAFLTCTVALKRPRHTRFAVNGRVCRVLPRLTSSTRRRACCCQRIGDAAGIAAGTWHSRVVRVRTRGTSVAFVSTQARCRAGFACTAHR